MSRKPLLFALFLIAAVITVPFAPMSFAQGNNTQIATNNYLVPHISTIPAIVGEQVQLGVRERIPEGAAPDGSSAAGKIVLFVHGANTPSEVGFDLPYEDYSWMGLLAEAGFDAFGMDMTGYGASTRPPLMDDPCNVSPQQQAYLVPTVLSGTCEPSYAHQLTGVTEDWAEIDDVVDYLRNLRHVDRIDLVGWSRGTQRAGGYAAQHPEKVDKLILYPPSALDTNAAPELPTPGFAFNINSRDDYFKIWNSQIGCADQVDPGIQDFLWARTLESDPTGSAWGAGVLRVPAYAAWGWSADLVAKVQAPTLFLVGDLDDTHQDSTSAVYAGIGSTRKVIVHVACSSHYMLWETRGHTIVQQTSLDWLEHGTVNGMSLGSLHLGD